MAWKSRNLCICGTCECARVRIESGAKCVPTFGAFKGALGRSADPSCLFTWEYNGHETETIWAIHESLFSNLAHPFFSQYSMHLLVGLTRLQKINGELFPDLSKRSSSKETGLNLHLKYKNTSEPPLWRATHHRHRKSNTSKWQLSIWLSSSSNRMSVQRRWKR